MSWRYGSGLNLVAIPERFIISTEHGTLKGCVMIGDFGRYLDAILAPVNSEIEEDFAQLQGIAQSSEAGDLIAVGITPKFPDEPYRVVTSLLETPQGQLIPQI